MYTRPPTTVALASNFGAGAPVRVDGPAVKLHRTCSEATFAGVIAVSLKAAELCAGPCSYPDQSVLVAASDAGGAPSRFVVSSPSAVTSAALPDILIAVLLLCAESPVDEAQPHCADGIVHVAVDQDDALPRPERRPALHDRDCQRRRDQCRQHVIASVAARPVPVPVAVLGGQHAVDQVGKVVLGSAARLDG